MLLQTTFSAIGLSAVTYNKRISGESLVSADNHEFSFKEQCNQNQSNLSQKLDLTNGDIIMSLKERLYTIDANITQLVLWLGQINDALTNTPTPPTNTRVNAQIHCGPGLSHQVVHLNI
jgi:hypothetical protein